MWHLLCVPHYLPFVVRWFLYSSTSIAGLVFFHHEHVDGTFTERGEKAWDGTRSFERWRWPFGGREGGREVGEMFC